MKRLFLSIITATATLVTFAQGYDAVATKTSMATTNNASANVQPFRFGYFSYREAFKSMPDYVIAQRNIDDLRTKAKFVRITSAGVRESHVHDVTITKEAPNYRVS